MLLPIGSSRDGLREARLDAWLFTTLLRDRPVYFEMAVSIKHKGGFAISSQRFLLADIQTETDSQLRTRVPDIAQQVLRTRVPDIAQQVLRTRVPDIAQQVLRTRVPDIAQQVLRTRVPDIAQQVLRTRVPDIAQQVLRTRVPDIAHTWILAEISSVKLGLHEAEEYPGSRTSARLQKTLKQPVTETLTHWRNADRGGRVFISAPNKTAVCSRLLIDCALREYSTSNMTGATSPLLSCTEEASPMTPDQVLLALSETADCLDDVIQECLRVQKQNNDTIDSLEHPPVKMQVINKIRKQRMFKYPYLPVSMSEADKRERDKGETATYVKCDIATKRKALNWRAVSTSCRAYFRNLQPSLYVHFEIQRFQKAVSSYVGVRRTGISNVREVLKALNSANMKCVFFSYVKTLNQVIVDLKKQLVGKEDKVKHLEDKLTQAQQQLDDQTEKEKQLNNTVRHLEDKLTQSQQQLDQQTEKEKQLNNTVKHLEDKLTQAQQQLDDQTEKEKQLNNTVKHLEDKLTQAQQQLDDQTEKEKQLNNTVKTLEDKLTQAQQQLDDQTEKEKQLNNTVKHLEDKLTQAQQQLDDQTEKEKQLNNTVKHLEDKLTQAQQQLDDQTEKEKQLNNTARRNHGSGQIMRDTFQQGMRNVHGRKVHGRCYKLVGRGYLYEHQELNFQLEMNCEVILRISSHDHKSGWHKLSQVNCGVIFNRTD
ncbi:hypothetical protein PR048_022565 [Dryococelus australis]|uniref:Uncharacterized protein n=1 Tax=Dryococelus australis TaxID=614101 RepID=A0ABQ9H1B6_9NEOP|nr:hypothetical protein PR048_022565 [Dryococelus australis]